MLMVHLLKWPGSSSGRLTGSTCLYFNQHLEAWWDGKEKEEEGKMTPQFERQPSLSSCLVQLRPI